MLFGILYLYLILNVVIVVVWDVGVLVDNDVGLFFVFFGSGDWFNFDILLCVVVVMGLNGKLIIFVLIYYILD